jgi:hypothetical protein
MHQLFRMRSYMKSLTFSDDNDNPNGAPSSLLTLSSSAHVMPSYSNHDGLSRSILDFQCLLDLFQFNTKPEAKQNVSKVYIKFRTDSFSPSSVKEVSSAYWAIICCLSSIGSLIPLTRPSATSVVTSVFLAGYQKQVAPAYYQLSKQISLAFGSQLKKHWSSPSC